MESWFGVVKLDVQYDHGLLLLLILILIIDNFFCHSISYIWHCCWRTFDVFISLYVLVEYCFFHDVPNCIIKEIEVTGLRRPVLLCDIISDILIEIIGNIICCVATSLIFLNSELLVNFHKMNSLLCKDVSSAFQVITMINSHTIFYKEQQAFSNLCICAFENVIV